MSESTNELSAHNVRVNQWVICT